MEGTATESAEGPERLSSVQSDDGVGTSPRAFEVLGVRVHEVQIGTAIEIVESWIRGRQKCHFVAVTGMHGITEARHSRTFKQILNAADLVVPDGMPLVWLGRVHGCDLQRRVYGPELMETFCRETATKSYRHFFFGGAPGIPDQLATVFRGKFPGLQVVGTHSPPFGLITAEQDDEMVRIINSSAADILWVGLSTPKQETWMWKHRERLNVPVLVGVGAAFDFHTGLKRQAPRWMQERGLEWLFRLTQEPGRLWRRYLLNGAEFLFCVLLQELGLRKFQ